MKRALSLLAAVSALTSFGNTIDLSNARAKKWRGEGTVDCIKVGSEAIQVVAAAELKSPKLRDTSKGDIIGYAHVPLSNVPASANAVCFEVKGNGLDRLASVFLSSGKAHIGFEAAFSLKNKEWHEVTIALKDFSRNFRGAGDGNYTAYLQNPEELQELAFGRGRHYHRYALSNWEFSVRNVRFISDYDTKPVPQVYSKGLDKTLSLIREGKPLKILMLGDSITDSGRDQTYAYHMGQKLKEKYGVECIIHNAGIGGHTVRAGRVVFPRGIAKMPNPDLVTMFYGANDCGATEKGMTAEHFQAQLEALIDSVRTATDGKADIMLFTGVQRLNKERTESRGVVERLVPGIKAAAKSRQTAVCDTIPVYAEIDQKKRLEVYNDTIHPNQTGQQFIGEIMYKTITDAL